MKAFFSNRNFLSSVASVVLSVAFVASVAVASTTISTNISTDGTLAVTGASTLTGAVTVAGVTTASGQLQASSTALFGAGVTVGTGTVANSLDGTILFKAQSSDPTGVTQGTIYYNSTSKVLKLFDGTSWFTTGTTTSGISLSGVRLQLGDLTTQYVALGTTTQQGSGQSVLTVEATSTTAIPLSLVGYTSQTGDLLDIFNSSSAKLLYVKSSGALFASSTLQVTGAVTTYGATTLGDAVGDSITLTGNATSTNNHYVGLSLTVGGNATTTSSGAVSIQGKFSVGTTTTPTSEISADGAATTTIGAFSSTSLVGGCIQLKGTDGLSYRMYVGGNEPATTTVSGKVGFLAVWEAGSCK